MTKQNDSTNFDASDLVLCESPDGWSLHAPGSTDEEIASGDARAILDGPGECTDADRERAFAMWAAKQGDSTNLTHAIERSRSHDEIVHLEVSDTSAALETLRGLAGKLEVDSCDLGGDEGVDVWAYDVDAPEGEMVWRLRLTAAV